MEQVKISLRLTNSLDAARTVVLEPWTGEYKLPPGKTYELVAEGDPKYPIEIELVGDTVTVSTFDSKGASLSIFEDGRELKSYP